MLVEIEYDDRERFREVYLHKVRPYFARSRNVRKPSWQILSGPGETFEALRRLLADILCTLS